MKKLCFNNFDNKLTTLNAINFVNHDSEFKTKKNKNIFKIMKIRTKIIFWQVTLQSKVHDQGFPFLVQQEFHPIRHLRSVGWHTTTTFQALDR